MANTIKLKRGSGSDPGTSDLSVGELAIRTDTALLFTKNDGGSVVPIGISDGDKGDITVSSNGGTFTIDNDAVSYAKIQNVSATDRLLGRDSSGAGIIEEIAPSAVRTMLGLAASATTDTTNASNISSGTLAAARVATLNQDTTGNAATATALETARTIAGVSFDGSANISLNNNAITNGAGYITATLTEEQVEDFVGGMVTGNTETGITVTYQDSDGTLDFVVASQTDENFTTTLKNKLDGIESGATADQSASEIVALIADQTIAPSTIDMEDNEKIKLGTGDDLEIFHDGSDSRIKDAGTGDLIMMTSRLQVNNAADSEAMINAVQDGAVELYYDNTKRFETQTGGAAVTGGLNVSGDVVVPDSSKFIAGTGDDLQILHDGSNSRIKDEGTGYLIHSSNGDGVLIQSSSGQNMAKFLTGAAVELYHNYSKKAETVSGGFTVTGTCTATAFAGDGSSLTGISAGATGGGSDEIFYENGQNVTTDYTITNGKNAMSAGPITIDSGVTVTVGSGETLTIV